MKKLYTLLRANALAFVISLVATPVFAVDYYSTGTHGFSQLTSWKRNATGTGTSPASLDCPGDRFIVQQGHTVTVDADEIRLGGLLVEGALVFGDTDGMPYNVHVGDQHFTVGTWGTVAVAPFVAMHRLYLEGGNFVNNGSFNGRGANSSQALNVYTSGTVAVQGANMPVFNRMEITGTTTLEVGSEFLGDISIVDAATLRAGGHTHLLRGNVYVGQPGNTNLVGFQAQSSTLVFCAPVSQVFAASKVTTLNNAQVNGGGTLVINCTAPLTFAGDFAVSNASSLQMACDVAFNGDFAMPAGCSFHSGTCRATFGADAAQSVDLSGDVEFYEVAFTGAGQKSVLGSIRALSTARFKSPGGVVDAAAGQSHYFGGNVHADNGAGFTGTLFFEGSTNFHSESVAEAEISIGAADIVVTGSLSLGSYNGAQRATLVAQGDVTLEGSSIVVRDGSFLRGAAGKQLRVKRGDLYAQGADNYPAGFGQYIHDQDTRVLYGGAMDQVVRGGVDYWTLELYNGHTKSLGGDIVVRGAMRLSASVNDSIALAMGPHDIELQGSFEDGWSKPNNPADKPVVVIVTADAGSTFTFAPVDASRSFYRRNPESQYQFHNFRVINRNPSAERTHTFHGNVPEDGFFDATDTNVDVTITGSLSFENEITDDAAVRANIDLQNFYFLGEDRFAEPARDFSIGSNVRAIVRGSSQFRPSMESFASQTLDANSTVSFQVQYSTTNLYPMTFGHLEFGADCRYMFLPVPGKPVRALGDVRRGSGNPRLMIKPSGAAQTSVMYVGGDWDLTNAYLDASGKGTMTMIFDRDGAQQISQATFDHVEFAGSGPKTLVGALTVLRSFTIGDAVQLDALEHTLTVGGNWNNASSGRFFHSGTVEFVGEGDQEIHSQTLNGSAFRHIRVNKPDGSNLLFMTDNTLTGNLDFVQGCGGMNLYDNTLNFSGNLYLRLDTDFLWTDGAKLSMDGNGDGQTLSNDGTSNRFPDIVFTGSSLKYLKGNPFYFDGDFVIDGAMVDASSGWPAPDIYLKGDFRCDNSGVLQHTTIFTFDGADQSIDAATFGHFVAAGTGTKTLTGAVKVNRDLTIEPGATLDVGAGNNGIELAGHWYNNRWSADGTQTGRFVARQGTVRLVGAASQIYTADSMAADYAGGIDGKHFYNLTVSKNDGVDVSISNPTAGTDASDARRIPNDLRVMNDFTLEQGRLWTNWNKMYVGGNFRNTGGDVRMSRAWFGLAGANYEPSLYLGGSDGEFVFDPGAYDLTAATNIYHGVNIVGTGTYLLGNDINLWSSNVSAGNPVVPIPALAVRSGEFRLNHHLVAVQSSTDAHVEVAAGATLVVDSLAELRMNDGARLQNSGTFKLVGASGAPATLRARAGSFVFEQLAGVTHARHYNIDMLRDRGLHFAGGTIDAVENLSDGAFTGGVKVSNAYVPAYITIGETNADFAPADITIDNVSFGTSTAADFRNVVRMGGGGAGVISFTNAFGDLAGEDHDMEPDGVDVVNWLSSGEVYWTGLAGDANWHTPGNWSTGEVPGAGASVIIDSRAGANKQVTISAPAQARSVIVPDHHGVTLTLNGGTLRVGERFEISHSENFLVQTLPTDTLYVGGSWHSWARYTPNQAWVVFEPTSGNHTIYNRDASRGFANLMVNGTGGSVKIASTSIHVHNNLVCNGNAVLDGDKYIIYVAGDWTSSPHNFKGNGGTVEFFGTNAARPQVIDGGVFNHVTFSGAAEKRVVSDITIGGTVDIKNGALLNGTTVSITVLGNWLNRDTSPNMGFTQQGSGVVRFSGGTQTLGYNSGTDTTQTKPMRFNHLTFTGGRKVFVNTVFIEGDWTLANGETMGYNWNNMGVRIFGTPAGRMTANSGSWFRICGQEGFPKGFGEYDLQAGSWVLYRDNIDQTITASDAYGRPISYYNLRLESYDNAHGVSVKTVDSDLRVLGELDINNNLDKKGGAVQLKMHYTDPETSAERHCNLFLEGRFGMGDLKESVDAMGNRIYPPQVDWGQGTFYHQGSASLTLSANMINLGNFVKSPAPGDGQPSLGLSNDVTVSGNMTLCERATLNMGTWTLTSDAPDKTFTAEARTRVYSSVVDAGAPTRYAFPAGFASYAIDPTSTYYVQGADRQTLYSGPEYGNVQLTSNNNREVHLSGDLRVQSEFNVKENNIRLIDNGHDIYVGGYTDFRNYVPSGGSTLHLTGSVNQTVTAGGNAPKLRINNLHVTGGGGVATLNKAEIIIKGNITIDAGDTLTTGNLVRFRGARIDNAGRINITNGPVFYFEGDTAKTINPGDNQFQNVEFQIPPGQVWTVEGSGFNTRRDFYVYGFDGTARLDMGQLTHRFGGTNSKAYLAQWDVSRSDLVFDGASDQYVPPVTCRNVTFATSHTKRLNEGPLDAHDVTINSGANFHVGTSREAAFPVTVRGSWVCQGGFQPYTQTVHFESGDSEPKVIASNGNNNFHNVMFNQSGATPRVYTLASTVGITEELTIGPGAWLKTAGHTLNLGNDDPEVNGLKPAGERHTIQAGGALEVQAGSKLIFNTSDKCPSLDIYGTLLVVGTEGSTADFAPSTTSFHQIGLHVRAYSGATVGLEHYVMDHLSYRGFQIDAGATIMPEHNLSHGTWRAMSTATWFNDPDVDVDPQRIERFLYLDVAADCSSLGDIVDVAFEFAGTPVAGRNVNVSRPASATGVMNFASEITGPLGVSLYEDDPGSLVDWVEPSELNWTGVRSDDWYDARNWFPQRVPTATLDVRIGSVSTHAPVIRSVAAQQAVCRNMTIDKGNLTVEGDVDMLQVKGNMDMKAYSILQMLGTTTVELSGDLVWNNRAIFTRGYSTLRFCKIGGTQTIEPDRAPLYNLHFDGQGTTFALRGGRIAIDGDITLSSGRLVPQNSSYRYTLKGDYTLEPAAGFADDVAGSFVFAGGNQSAHRARFNQVDIQGTGVTTFHDTAYARSTTTIRAGGHLALDHGAVVELRGNFAGFPGSTLDNGDAEIWMYGTSWSRLDFDNNCYQIAGDGVVRFRGNTHYIYYSRFNNVVFENPAGNSNVYVYRPMNVNGNVDVGCSGMTLTANGTVRSANRAGVFALGTTPGLVTRLYMKGADNFPVNFAAYTADPDSYAYYDMAGPQTVRAMDDGIEVQYGNLYLKSGAKTLNGNAEVLGSLTIEASTAFDCGNYTLKVGRHWYNNKGGEFLCREGEVIFDGAGDQTISTSASSSNDFFKLRVNKKDAPGANVTSGRPLTVKDKLWVQAGRLVLSSSTQHEVRVGGDLIVSDQGSVRETYGHFIMDKEQGSVNIQSNGSTLYRMTLQGDCNYNLLDDLSLFQGLDVAAGTLDLAGHDLNMTQTTRIVDVAGTLVVGPGSTMRLSGANTLNVKSGGHLRVVGDAGSTATVTRYLSTSGNYGINVREGGKISARHYNIEHMSTSGVYVMAGAEIDPVDNFSDGILANPQTGGTCLRIENDQTIDAIENIAFPTTPQGATRNITKTLSSGGAVEIAQWSGAMAGPLYENDPNNLINWRTGNVITWRGGYGTGDARYNWAVPENWDLGRVPTADDNVVIPTSTLATKCEIRLPADDSIKVRSLEVTQNALYLFNTPDAGARTVNVSGPVNLKSGAKVVFDNAATRLRMENDYTAVSGDNLQISAAGGTLEFAGTGNATVNGVLSSQFAVLEVTKQGELFMPQLSTTVGQVLISPQATLTLSHSNANKELRVAGDFVNRGLFRPNSGKLTLSGAGSRVIEAGSATYGVVTVAAGAYTLAGGAMTVADNMTVAAPASFDIAAGRLDFGNAGTARVLAVDGTFAVGAGGQLTLADKSSVAVGGNFRLIGAENNLAQIRNQGAGSYGFAVNTGGRLSAQHYSVANIGAEGIVLATSASIDPAANLSFGSFMYGQPGGRYLDIRCAIPEGDTIRKVGFAAGPRHNVKRNAAYPGQVVFKDSYGLLSGSYYEDDVTAVADDPNEEIVWKYSNPYAFWVGSTVTPSWHAALNWNPAEVPPANATVMIVPLDNGNYYPEISEADVTVRSLDVYEGTSVTMADGRNLTVAGNFSNGGRFEIAAGSPSTVAVGGAFSNNGDYRHGGASTLELRSQENVDLAIENTALYSLKLNSPNGAVFTTRTDIALEGNFSISNGTLVVGAPSHRIRVGGNWSVTNSGHFEHGGGTVHLDGNNEQTIYAAGGNPFNDLRLTGAGRKRLSSGITIDGDLYSASHLSAGMRDIYIYGDWRGTALPSASFERGTGAVRFMGSATQTVAKRDTFNTVWVSNSSHLAALVLEKEMVVAGVITMAKGRVQSGLQNCLTLLDGAQMQNAGPQSYVDGYIRKNGDEDFTFHLGTEHLYAPITLTGINTNSSFRVTYEDRGYNYFNLGEDLNRVSRAEYWNVTRLSGTATPTATLEWRNGTYSGITELDPLVVAHYTGGTGWSSKGQGAVSGTTAQGSVTSLEPLTQFGYITIGWRFADLYWTGAADRNWNNAANWEERLAAPSGDVIRRGGGIPDLSTNVHFDGNEYTRAPQVNISGARCYDAILTNEAELVINAGKTLRVGGNMEIDSYSYLELGAGANVELNGNFDKEGYPIWNMPGTTIVFKSANPQTIKNMGAGNLWLDGPGTKTLDGQIIINENLRITAKDVQFGNAEIQLAGDFDVQSGTVSSGNSTLHLIGNKKQTFRNPSALQLKNLTVNWLGLASTPEPHVELEGHVTVQGNLDIKKGVVKSDADRGILTLGLNGTVTGGGPQAYVTGRMRKNGVTDFTFPMGKNGRWARLGISQMHGSGAFDVEYDDVPAADSGNLSADLARVSGLEHWKLLRAGGSGTATPTVTLYWNDNAASGIDSVELLTMAHYNGQWTKVEATAQWDGGKAGRPGSITTNGGQSAFGTYTFGSIVSNYNPLPIVLTRFDAAATPQGAVLVEWETASEYDNDRFVVERSLDGATFETVGQVASAGNRSTPTQYALTDPAPHAGRSYYRLRQIDLDGAETLSHLAAVFVGGASADTEPFSTLFPNPTDGRGTLRFSRPAGQRATIRVVGVSGNVAAAADYNIDGAAELDITPLLSGLATGVYHVSVVADGLTQTHRVMVR